MSHLSLLKLPPSGGVTATVRRDAELVPVEDEWADLFCDPLSGTYYYYDDRPSAACSCGRGRLRSVT